MATPLKSLKEANLRIEELENQIEQFKTHTKKKFYLGIQRQLDLLGDEMLSDDFKVSMKKTFTEGSKEGKMVMQDSGFEGFFDMLIKGEAIIKAMQKFEEDVFNKPDDSKKVVKEDGVEQFIKATTLATTT